MKEYIERATVLNNLGYEENRRGDVLPGSTFDIVLKEPAADVAEVVRCGQCKYSGPASKLSQKYGAPGVLTCHGPLCNRRNVTETDFCSRGARMEKEDET